MLDAWPWLLLESAFAVSCPSKVKAVLEAGFMIVNMCCLEDVLLVATLTAHGIVSWAGC